MRLGLHYDVFVKFTDELVFQDILLSYLSCNKFLDFADQQECLIEGLKVFQA